MRLQSALRAVEWTLSTVRKLARVTAYFALITLALLCLAVRSVRAAVHRSALEIGQGLTELGDVPGHGYRIRFNGEPMQIASATTEMAVDAVLDGFEKECREHSGALKDEFGSLPQTLKRPPSASVGGAPGLGVLRDGDGSHGVVACIAPDGAPGWHALVSALRGFAESGDLGAIGGLRYVAASRVGEGATHVVSVWTDGHFSLPALFPDEGDAAGPAPPDGARPIDARRILAASIEGSPFGVQVYESRADTTAVLAQLERDLSAHGWRALELPEGVPADAGRLFLRDSADLLVAVSKEADGPTVVSLGIMPAR